MTLRNMPIRRKLIVIILIISVVVMLLMHGAFFTYEYVTFRRAMIQRLATLGEILATNSTAALAFEDREDAGEILAALKAERHIVAAAFYDRSGRLFAEYPGGLPAAAFPSVPGADGFRFGDSHLAGFQPVVQKERRLGTLYLQFDTGIVMREWIWGSLRISLMVMTIILLVAYALSRVLQKQISHPILALAETVRTISERRDYSVRAVKLGQDEVGMLTDGFNQMLDQIQAQNQTLRQNEAELQTIIENLGEGLVVSDLNGQLLHFNRAALDLHGFSSLDECHRHLSEFVSIFELSTLDGAILPVEQWPLARILRGEHLRDWEVRIRSIPSGWNRIFNYGGVFVHDPAGRPLMAVVTMSDITGRKQAEEEIRRLNQELEQRVISRTAQLEASNHELEAFCYSVSHDLRAPLRHIDGFSSLLTKHAGAALDDKGRRYLGTISEAARRMGQLIDDLLGFSRAGRVPLNFAPVDHDALVGAVIRDGRYDRNGLAIAWRIAPLPPVHADLALLRQVWANLIDNAVKYSGRSPEPCIEIGSQTDARNGELVFHVRDNGVGFDMQYAAKLFGVFQRLHTLSEFEGTGVGLANVRRIVQRHGGRTWAEGRVNAGATFYFSLPGSRSAAAAGADANQGDHR
jgi:PAS domain S-box-containing protein